MPELAPASSFLLVQQKAYSPASLPAITFASERIKRDDALRPIHQLEIQKIRDYTQLTKNWDSYGAAPIPEESIQKAIVFVRAVDRYNLEVDAVSPGPNGEIMVRLKARLREIEFIFYPEHAHFVRFGDDNFSEQGRYTPEQLPALIEWLQTS